eukprot:g2132.t1
MLLSGLNSLKKGASSMAVKTSAIAKATGEKADKAGFTTANLKKGAVEGAQLTKKVVCGAVNTMVTPELLDFCKHPSPEKLKENPQIVITALKILTAMGNPQAAVCRALLLSSVSVGSGVLVQSSEKAIHAGTAQVGGAIVEQQTGGMISHQHAAMALKAMSPEQTKQMVQIVRMCV